MNFMSMGLFLRFAQTLRHLPHSYIDRGGGVLRHLPHSYIDRGGGGPKAFASLIHRPRGGGVLRHLPHSYIDRGGGGS